MSDVFALIIWWLLLQAMGWVALPLLFRVLRWLPDRGYMMAKPAGLLLGNYVLWLFGTFGWLRNSEGGILIAFGLVLAFGLWVYHRWNDGVKLLDWLRTHRAQVLAYEAVFLGAFVIWAIFRAYNPDLYTTEKPMEYAFMNSIIRSPTFPAPDPWLSGFSISYYHFGYIMMSTLTKLSGVTSGVAFGLSNALWFALTASTAFGVVSNMVAASNRATRTAIVSAGVLGAVFVALLGNFEAPLDVAHSNGVGSAEFWRWLDILEINTPPPNPPTGPSWPFCDRFTDPAQCSGPRGGFGWTWRASRVVHDYPLGSDRSDPTEYQEAITEFPMFSFLLGDMHPHVLALPYALMSMALAFNLYRMSELRAEDEEETRSTNWHSWLWTAAPIGLLYPIFLGALSFLNTWDFPIHVAISVTAWGLGRWMFRRIPWPNMRTIVSDAFYALIACGILGVIAFLPFYIGFRSQLGGIVPNIYNPTRWQQFVVMFGPFLLIGLVFVVVMIGRAVLARRVHPLVALGGTFGGGALLVVGAGVVTGVLSVLMLLLPGVRDKFDQIAGDFAARGISLDQVLNERLGEVSVPLLLGVLMAAIIVILIARARQNRSATQDAIQDGDREDSASFALMLLLVGAVSTFLVEYVYLLDFFGFRINTIFKLYYQTWALWGVAAAYIVFYLLQSAERLRFVPGRIAFAALFALVLVGGMMYPVIAMRDKVDPARVTGQIPPTLDATDPTRRSTPDEVAVIDWLEQNVQGRPVILEAEGIPYRDFTSRLSAWTGLPTVIGWVGHEGQWRGVYDDIVPRQQDIDKLYTTTDLALARELLDKYDIEYVYIGPNERDRYPQDGLEKFGRLMSMAIQQGGSTLYRRMSSVPSGVVSTN